MWAGWFFHDNMQQHREEVVSRGILTPLRRRVTRWQIEREMFSWSTYVCHVTDCHCNCETCQVISPFASLWCFFNPNVQTLSTHF